MPASSRARFCAGLWLVITRALPAALKCSALSLGGPMPEASVLLMEKQPMSGGVLPSSSKGIVILSGWPNQDCNWAVPRPRAWAGAASVASRRTRAMRGKAWAGWLLLPYFGALGCNL